MTDVARQNARNRRAGKAWERDLEQQGRKLGHDIDRTRDTGLKDQGDLVIRSGGRYFVVEAKNAKLQPGPFVDEALLEAKHFAEFRGLDEERVHPVVFVKKAGKSDIRDGLALLPIGEYLRLVKAVGS